MADRLAFERGARRVYPTLRGRHVRRSGRGGFIYTVELDVPFYEKRRVTIHFPTRPLIPSIRADGPAASRHRFDDGTLCIWFPRDPVANRWVFADGLLDLLDAVVAHLFREAWWRETGEWLGDEVPHLPAPTAEAAA